MFSLHLCIYIQPFEITRFKLILYLVSILPVKDMSDDLNISRTCPTRFTILPTNRTLFSPLLPSYYSQNQIGDAGAVALAELLRLDLS